MEQCILSQPMQRALWFFLTVVTYFALSAEALADSRVKALTKSLREDSSFKVRAKAAEVLAKGGYSDAIPALIEALQQDENEVVRAAAAAALGVLGGASGDPTLQKEALSALKAAASNDRSSLVRSEAQKATGRFPVTGTSGGYLIGGVYFDLGKFTSTAKPAEPKILSRFESLLTEQLASGGREASAPPRGKKPITLAGSLQKVELKKGKSGTILSMKLSVTVTRDSSILAIIQKQGEIELDPKPSAAEEEEGKEAILEALVEGVYQDLGKNLAKWK